MQRRHIPVKDTDNEVLPGITLMTDLVGRGDLTIHQGCLNLIREIQAYSWDDKSAKRGEDKPIKQNDHAVDGLRYALKGFLGKKSSFYSSGNRHDPNFGRGLGQAPVTKNPWDNPNGQWRMK